MVWIKPDDLCCSAKLRAAIICISDDERGTKKSIQKWQFEAGEIGHAPAADP
jgi:hypothetical protein